MTLYLHPSIHKTHTHARTQGDYNKAGKVYSENCAKYSHPPSCFNLGRLYRTLVLRCVKW